MSPGPDESSGRSRRGFQLAGWGALAIAALAFALPASALVRGRLRAPHAAPAAVHTVRAGDFTTRVPASGELEAASSISIAVPRVQTGGLTIFSLVRDGTVVRQGDTLVEFDATELLQQLEEADHSIDAALRELEASVLRGQADTAQIVADHAIADMELDKARTQAPRDPAFFSMHEIRQGELDISLSNTKAAEYVGKIETSTQIEALSKRILVIDRTKQETRRGQLKDTIGSLKLLAPRDGMVLITKDLAGNSVMVGETRWPGFVLMTMPDTSVMKARTQVLESDAGLLKVGQPAAVVVDSHPGRTFDAVVERVDAIARALDKDSPVKYVEVLLRLTADAPDVLKAGKLVHAEIRTGAHTHVLAVPRIAVVEQGGGHAVWLAQTQGATRRVVKTGAGDLTRVIVSSGLAEGDTIRLDPPRDAAGDAPADASRRVP